MPKYLSENPARDAKSLRVEQEHRVRYLTAEEESRLRDALNEREADLRTKRRSANKWRAERGYDLFEDLSNLPFADHLKPMVILSMNTGLRQGELFSLEWRDVTEHAVTVRAGVAKSRKSRSVPLNAEARQTLESWRNQSGDAGYVFKGRVGRFDNVRKAWASVLDDARIVDFRWHDLRHHFASKLAMKGAPLNDIRDLLGHANLKMVLRYAHLSPAHLRNTVELLDG